MHLSKIWTEKRKRLDFSNDKAYFLLLFIGFDSCSNSFVPAAFDELSFLSSYTLQRRELNSGGCGGLGGSGSSSMQATIGCLSRIVGRTLVSSHGSQSSHSSQQHPTHRNRTCSTTSSVASSDGTQG